MLVWLTLPFYDFCCFRSVAVNSVYKLQFFYIYKTVKAPKNVIRISCNPSAACTIFTKSLDEFIRNIFIDLLQLITIIKTCEAGLVLSVTRILRPIPCVCMYVCMWSNSSQTTEPICIKIIPAYRAFYADCYRLLRFEIFTKYDEYFVIERAPFLNKCSFATALQRQ